MGYLQAPGLIFSQRSSTCGESGTALIYRLYEHPLVQNAIKQAWAVNTPSISITPITCFGYTAGYNLYASNQDCSSTYTWHIQRSNGIWENFTYGGSRTFKPSFSDTYTIYLRQDNLALQSYGTQTLQISTFLQSASTCVGPRRIKNNSSNDSSYNNLELQNIVNVKPNPANDKIIITYYSNENSAINISLFDIVGNKILTLKEGISVESNDNISEEFDVSKIVPGVYIIFIKIDNQVEKIKLVKI